MKTRTQRQRLQARVIPEAEPPLSPLAAFVVQFRDGTDPTSHRLSGRVEHMISGEAARFDSADELMGFFVRVLSAARITPAKER